MAFRSVNFWKNLSERWSVHVLLTHQRPGNQLVILRGVSREWYLFEKDRGNEETTVVVWSWVDIILRTCSCSLLRLSKQSYVGFHMARDEGRPLATSSLAVGRFGAKKGSLRSPRGRLVASLLLTQNKEKRRAPLRGTLTPQANMEVTLPHSGKNYGHRSVKSLFSFFHL